MWAGQVGYWISCGPEPELWWSQKWQAQVPTWIDSSGLSLIRAAGEGSHLFSTNLMMVKIQAVFIFPSLSHFVECILYFWKNCSIFIQNSLIFHPTLSLHTLLLYNLHCYWVKGWEERRSVFYHRLGFGTEGEERRDAGVRCLVYVSYVCITLYV